MNYQKIFNFDMVNGRGLRVTLFVSGCNHKCRGCYNKSTWNPKNGKVFSKQVEDDMFAMLGDPRIRGLSLSGGDPLFRDNLNDIERIIDRCKREYPEKDIWMWTGYTLEELDDHRRRIVDKVDVLIDGKYDDTRPTTKPFRGSDNQRLIEIKTL